MKEKPSKLMDFLRSSLSDNPPTGGADREGPGVSQKGWDAEKASNLNFIRESIYSQPLGQETELKAYSASSEVGSG
jgi:hypothetical protein